MGTVRLFLALSVLIWHLDLRSSFFYFMYNSSAVQGFFIISGYYMALVYPRYKSKFNFIINRFIRLYPVYAVGCLFDLANRGVGNYIEQLYDLPFLAQITLLITQVFLFFHEWNMWLFIEGGQLVLGLHGSDTPSVNNLTLVKQAWSLSIEAFFYLMVPYIVTKTRTIKIIFVLALGVQILMNHFEILTFLSFHRALPGAMLLFMLGAFCCHHKSSIAYWTQRIPIHALLAILVLYISFSGYFISNQWQERIIFFFLLCAALPALSDGFRYSTLDRWLGELSYPLCVVHYTVIDFIYPVTPALKKYEFLSYIVPAEDAWFYKVEIFKSNLVILLISILLSIAMYYMITVPLEWYRQKIKAGN